MPDKNINNLKVMLSAMQEDHLGKGDFTTYLEKVIAYLNKIEAKMVKDLGLAQEALDNALTEVKNTTKTDFSTQKGSIDTLVGKHLSNSQLSLDNKLNELTVRMSEIKNGKDANVDDAVAKVVELIKIPTIEELKDDLPKMGMEVRDALELLKDEERLDASAIKGLKKLIEKYSKGTLVGGGGGTNLGFNYIIDDEVPVGTINGVNKAFKINNIPSPATSLKVFVNGQKMTLTEDYTYASQTITFVTAPPTTSIITVDYRV